MANEIPIHLDLTGERKVERGLEVVEKQAEKTGDAIEEMGDQATVAGKDSEKSSDGLKKVGDEAGHLKREVDELSASYAKLLEQFNITGDESLKKDIGKERRKLNAAKRNLRDLLPDPAAVTDAGTSIGAMLAEGIGTGAKAGGPYLTAVLVGAAALAVPGIAATLGAAVIGGVGIGGIVGGVTLAARDPRVQAAGKRVGETLLDEFTDATRGFVDPIIRSLDKVGDADFAAKLGPTFDKLAKHVEPLAEGLIGLVDNALPGLERAADAAGPVLDMLAASLPDIGAALNDFFESLADDPEALANALDLFLGAVTDAIRFGGDFIEVLIGVYDVAYTVADALGLIEDEIHRVGGKIGQGGATKDVKDFAKATGDAEEAARGFDDAIKEVFGRTLSVRQATLRYQQALDDLREGLTDGKRALDEHTDAGRDGWEGIIQATEAIEGNREARIRQKMSIEEANAKYDLELEALRKQLLALGYNKDAVNKYIAEMKKIPLQAITEVHIKGIKAALADVRALAEALGIVAGYGIIQGASKASGDRAASSAATGSRAAMVGAGQPTAGAPQVIVSVKDGSDKLMAAVIESLRFEIRTTANGDPVEFLT